MHSILDAEGGYGFLGSDRAATADELEADMRLIKAAPELLATLEQINELCGYATEEGAASRLFALRQIGLCARAAMALAARAA